MATLRCPPHSTGTVLPKSAAAAAPRTRHLPGLRHCGMEPPRRDDNRNEWVEQETNLQVPGLTGDHGGGGRGGNRGRGVREEQRKKKTTAPPLFLRRDGPIRPIFTRMGWNLVFKCVLVYH